MVIVCASGEILYDTRDGWDIVTKSPPRVRNAMNNENGNGSIGCGLALAMVVVGGLAIWFVFGGIIIDALTMLLIVL